MTSSDLLTPVRQHDRDAWHRFVTLYGPMVNGWCRQAALEPADAGDVMQEVFTNVFTAIHDFRHDRPGDTLRGWLRVICRNKLCDYHRGRAGSPHAQGGSHGAAFVEGLPEADVDESTVQSERYALVRRGAEVVREQFEPRTWRAFWLVTVEHCTAAEAAAQLGMTAGAVRQAKYMVLRKLIARPASNRRRQMVLESSGSAQSLTGM